MTTEEIAESLTPAQRRIAERIASGEAVIHASRYRTPATTLRALAAKGLGKYVRVERGGGGVSVGLLPSSLGLAVAEVLRRGK